MLTKTSWLILIGAFFEIFGTYLKSLVIEFLAL